MQFLLLMGMSMKAREYTVVDTYIFDGHNVFDQLGAVQGSGVIETISWHVGGDVDEKLIEESDFEDLVVSQQLQGGGCILAQRGGETRIWKETAGQFLNAEQLSIVGIREPIRQREGRCDGSSSERDDVEKTHSEGFGMR